ncbi:oxygenase MpaB family protein [Nocardia sp. NPDC050378]|uniref:oxygenase MpaB family protein n=1 Tax=Nocardia sp. NPDC050378 TaxID=3155400 RepID=UPI00340A4126
MTEQLTPTDSLLRRYLGDRRFALALPRAVSLQVLHPAIAAALTDHVHYRLWSHKQRSITRMIHLAYTGTNARFVIRAAHEHVKGRDSLGHRYHALNPEVFHFQHATYVETLFTAVNTFIRPMSADEHEQLYAECCAWYRRYELSTRPMPTTWAEFVTYFEQACATTLRVTAATETLAPQALRPDAWVPRFTPTAVIPALLHDRAAQLLDVTVTRRDRRALRTYATTLRGAGHLTPRSIRYLRVARL